MGIGRITLTFNSVGTSFTEKTQEVPSAFIMIRARAEIVSGSGSTIALSVRETSNPSDVVDVALEYSLTTSPLDSGEYVVFKSPTPTSQNSGVANAYIAVKVNAGSDSVVRVSIDYTTEN